MNDLHRWSPPRDAEIRATVVSRQFSLVSWRVSTFSAWCSAATNMRFQSIRLDLRKQAKVYPAYPQTRPAKHWRKRHSPVSLGRTWYRPILTLLNDCVGARRGALGGSHSFTAGGCRWYQNSSSTITRGRHFIRQARSRGLSGSGT